jgi:competence/damage-inducible protein CinA-like protein
VIARLLLVGDELLGGTVSDRNTAQVARAFGPRGVALERVETVGDDPEAIAAAARRLAQGCGALVVTGGLGPTEDDRTREAMARALGTALREDGEVRAQIEARFAAIGIERPADSVRHQATFPAGTEVVPNPIGSAPGFTGMLGSCRFWVLPGVPMEVAGMLPAVVAALPAPAPGHGWERIIATAGRGETRVAERLEAVAYTPGGGIHLAYLPSPGGVVLRLFAAGGAADAAFDDAERRIRDVLADWALPGPSIQESLVARLSAHGATIATAESCTGGMIGARITDVPGASSVYLGGVVAYADAVKTGQLVVPEAVLEEHGAVSEPVVRAMAAGARGRFAATLAVAVTGIAGPDGGTPDKPVGTVWIAVADAAGEEARCFLFRGTRDMVRERTVNKALEMAYRRGP